jgi:type IV pilus assembly protein PilY1
VDAIDYVYGADYFGNIWRFDLSSSSSSSWSTTLIYNSSGRFITSEIAVGTPPKTVSGGAMIYFGTGRYLNSTDATDTTTVNALYGIYDNQVWSSSTTAYIGSDTELSIGGVTLASLTSDTRSTTMSPTTSTSTTTSVTPWWDITGKKGWMVPLNGTNVAAGERVIAPPVRYTQAGKVDAFLFTSIVPGTDECIAALDSWITAVDPLTGAGTNAFKGLTGNSVKVVGGSPRGVFVLAETKAPTLYISQTVFDLSKPPTSTYGTIAGGSQTVCINGVCGKTRVLGIELTPGSVAALSVTRRQVWRQLK